MNKKKLDQLPYVSPTILFKKTFSFGFCSDRYLYSNRWWLEEIPRDHVRTCPVISFSVELGRSKSRGCEMPSFSSPRCCSISCRGQKLRGLVFHGVAKQSEPLVNVLFSWDFLLQAIYYTAFGPGHVLTMARRLRRDMAGENVYVSPRCFQPQERGNRRSMYINEYPLVNVYIVNTTMESHHFSRENSLFLWPCSTAMLNHKRAYK